MTAEQGAWSRLQSSMRQFFPKALSSADMRQFVSPRIAWAASIFPELADVRSRLGCARLTVHDIDRVKRRVTLDCVCLVGEKAVLKGEALAPTPSKKFD